MLGVPIFLFTDFLFSLFFFFFFNDTATTEIYTLSLHDALPIYIYRAEVFRIKQQGDRKYIWRDTLQCGQQDIGTITRKDGT